MAVTFKRDSKGQLIAYRDGKKVGPIYSTGDPVKKPAAKQPKKKKK